MVEFWFTAGATFFYFTAFVSILSGFVGVEDEEWQYWIDANIAAGVFGLLNDAVYAAGAYLIYMDWKANPTGCAVQYSVLVYCAVQYSSGVPYVRRTSLLTTRLN